MWRRSGRQLRAATLLPLYVLGTVTGCTSGTEAESTSTMKVRVLVRDINLREVGVDCAGTGPYTFLHNKTPYRIVDGDGQTLADGKLSAGTSVRVFNEELGVSRVPTYCEFATTVSVPQRAGYRLAVDDHPPIDLAVNNAEGPALVAVVPS